MNPWQIIIPLLLVVLSLALLLSRNLRARIVERFFIMPAYDTKVTFFEEDPIGNNDIVFLGDSLTEEFPLTAMFPGAAVVNRGISGDTTRGVLQRLDQVTNGRPYKIFLMIGTNDIGFGYGQNPTLANYEEIVAKIRRESPESQLFLQSVLPREKRNAERVFAINQKIAALAQQYDCAFIDLYPAFADSDGTILPQFSDDELHLLELGYELWQSLIEPFVLE
jgi:lysophospholipase L1-like esterase